MNKYDRGALYFNLFIASYHKKINNLQLQFHNFERPFVQITPNYN